MKKALRGCAEAGVPETVDLWPGLQERMTSRGRRSFRTWLAPRTRVGWVFAVAVALLVTTGAGYAATELADKMFRSELPGAAEEADLGVLLDERRTIDGTTVNLHRVYADATHVVVSLSVEGARDGRQIDGDPVEFSPIFAMDEPGYEPPEGQPTLDELLPVRGKLVDESGEELAVVGGQGMISGGPDQMMDGPVPHTLVFASSGSLEPGGEHRFRLEVPLEGSRISAPSGEEGEASPEETPPQGSEARPLVGPFVFEFDVPVKPVPVVEVDQQIEASGVEITLDRIYASPGRPEAVFCFDPPDESHYWGAAVKKSGPTWSEPADGRLKTRPTGDGCFVATLSSKARDYSSLTVTEIEGFPKNGDVDGPEDIKTIRGPWVFDFEIPER